jgi:putative tryptophan/tyrosine transport system substrate-binding protein
VEKNMKKELTVLTLCAMLFALSLRAEAQQTARKIPLIGVLRFGTPSSHAAQNEAFRQGLRELAYVEGKNIIIEYRYAEGKIDRLPGLAAELVRLKVNVILVGGTDSTRSAKQATSTIPIVVGNAGDLVGAGLVASLAKPGGNITGSTTISPDLSGKRLELLKEVVPNVSRVAVIWNPQVGGTTEEQVKQTESAARQFELKIQSVAVRDPSEFEGAYAMMTKQGASAVIIIRGALTLFHRKQLTELAVKNRMPSMCEGQEFVDDACLIAYGPDLFYLWRRAAVFVDKILKGTKPTDLPVEQPTKFELVINLKTAKQIGLIIPQWVLMRADRVVR